VVENADIIKAKVDSVIEGDSDLQEAQEQAEVEQKEK